MNKYFPKIFLTSSFTALLVILNLLSSCTSNVSSQLLFSSDISQSTDLNAAITVNVPVGPETGYSDEKLTYSFDVKSTIDGVYLYGFDWGDGSYTWTTSSIASHSWAESGIYIVRVQARCGDSSSRWSAGKVVMIGTARLSRSPLDMPAHAIQYITPDTPEIVRAVQFISSKWGKHYNTADACREWVSKNIKYKRDQDVYNLVDYWQFPIETIERGTGDCEDIAVLLCSLLRASGVPADQVYVAVGSPVGIENAHAYIIERYSKGVWNIIEPQLDLVTSTVSFTFLDWAFTSDYSSDLYCFNDRYFFRGLPTALASVIYELNIWHSFWPVLLCSSNKLQKHVDTGEKIECTVEWLNKDRILFDWTINVYGPANDIAYTWSGNDIRYKFSYMVEKSGLYGIEIIKRDYAPRNVRLITNQSGWMALKE